MPSVINAILKNRWRKTWLINYFKKCTACISYFIGSQSQSLIKPSPHMLLMLAAILTLPSEGKKGRRKKELGIMIWPSVGNCLICCSNGLLIVSWTSISKGMKIVVKLVPCLSFLLSFAHLRSLPLLLSLSLSVWIANRPRRGPGGIK